MRHLYARITTLGVVAVLATGITPGRAHAQLMPKFGIMAGGNVEALADLDGATTLNAVFGVSSGYHFGAFADIGTPIVGIRPAAIYLNAGSLFAGATFLSVDNFKVSYLTFPIDVQLNAIPVLYLFAGPEFQVMVSSGAPSEFESSIKSFTAKGGVGLGFDFGPVFIESRYLFSLTKLTESTYQIGAITVTGADQASSAVRFSLGVSF